MKRYCLALVFWMSLAVTSAFAQNQNVISVIGEGTVTADTDMMTIEGRLQGSAKSMKNAVASFKETKQKFIEKMNPMDFPDISIEFRGKVISKGGVMNEAIVGMMMIDGGGGDPEDAESNVDIKETVAITIKHEPGKFDEFMEEAGKVVDALADTEITLGTAESTNPWTGMVQSSTVTADISDKSAFEGKAFAEAMADARKKAELLAKLSGVELGPIVGVSEMVANDVNDANSMQILYGSLKSSDAASIGTMEITKRLTIQFSIK